jgi:hypothetical protein
VTDERRLLHDFILDILYKTKDVIVLRDSENVLGFVYVSTSHSCNFRAVYLQEQVHGSGERGLPD